ncbi:hypothetical protein [Rhodococcus sp. P1Y]|uniref:hypothetical protein n=1 Tax=Rhodococcus sp. P1Y TaxID=1302308 RepID=UPI0012938161|nr:hypothetical protein [Rhodococcus sp. P1Y]
MRSFGQVLVGLVLGFVFAWAGIQVIPVQSGALTAALTLAAAVVLAAIVLLVRPQLRTAAIAFAIAAALLTGLLFLVVID